MPSFQSNLQPMYSGHVQDQPMAAQYRRFAQRSAKEQQDMEAAFERALEDAKAQSAAEQAEEAVPPAEEVKEAKGDFEAVWESLKPEAERLNKLAEWERDFSQVCLGSTGIGKSCRGVTLILNLVYERRGRPF
jgi:peroxin-5